MDMLDAWGDERRTAAAAPGGQGYVFSSSPSGDYAWRPDRTTSQVATLAAQTGVSASVHVLHRYNMARLAVLGVPADVAAQRLGLRIVIPSCCSWSAEAVLPADREAALLLAIELDADAGGGQADDWADGHG